MPTAYSWKCAVLASEIKAKQPQRDALAQAVEAFKKKGGQIDASYVPVKEWVPDYFLNIARREKQGLVAEARQPKHPPPPKAKRYKPANPLHAAAKATKVATQPAAKATKVAPKPTKVAPKPTKTKAAPAKPAPKQQSAARRELARLNRQAQQLQKEIDALFARLIAKENQGKKA